MASAAKIKAAYTAIMPLVEQEVALAPFFFRGEIETEVASAQGVSFAKKLIGVIIDAAAKVSE